jgi:phosphoglycolate phosphatase-like HAD superfamily hydrolase
LYEARYEIEEEKLSWVGEGWRFCEGPMQEYDPAANTTWRIDNLLEQAVKVVELESYRLRVYFGISPKKIAGRVLQMRDGIQDQVGAFMLRSCNIKWKQVGFHFMHGLGLVGQFSENLTFDELNLAPRSETGRTVAAFADFIHLSGCRGKVEITNSQFIGAQIIASMCTVLIWPLQVFLRLTKMYTIKIRGVFIMSAKKLILFLDSGDTIIDETTEIRDSEGIVLSASVIPGADVMIKTLFERGYTLVLVADGDAQSFKNMFKQLGLYDYFTAMIYSENIKATKPSPRMFKAAAGAIELNEADYSRIVMVGNNLSRDIKGANALGITSVFLSWTSRYPRIPADESERPVYTIREPLELLDLAEQLNDAILKRVE